MYFNGSVHTLYAALRGAVFLVFFIGQSRTFTCSLDHAKRLFYRAVNGIFGKIGRIASNKLF